MDSLVDYGYRIYVLELEVCIKYLVSCCYDGNCIGLYLYGYLYGVIMISIYTTHSQFCSWIFSITIMMERDGGVLGWVIVCFVAGVMVGMEMK
jgi:hypothetical protein